MGRSENLLKVVIVNIFILYVVVKGFLESELCFCIRYSLILSF